MRRTLVIVGLVAGWFLSAAAQTAQPAIATPGPRYEAFAGFSRMRGDIGTDARANGFAGAFTVRLNRHIAIDALGSGSSAPSQEFPGNTRLYTLLFGPRLSFPVRLVTPFIHVGLGYARWHPGEHVAARSGLGKMGGLGLDISLPRGFAYRLIQADYVRTPFNSGDNGIFSTGVIYRFGAR